jgi:hypothetical protein
VIRYSLRVIELVLGRQVSKHLKSYFRQHLHFRQAGRAFGAARRREMTSLVSRYGGKIPSSTSVKDWEVEAVIPDDVIGSIDPHANEPITSLASKCCTYCSETTASRKYTALQFEKRKTRSSLS